MTPRFAVALTAALSAALIAAVPTPLARQISTGGLASAISAGVAGGSLNNRAVLWTGARVTDLHPAGFTFSAVHGRDGTFSVGYAGTGALAQTPILWRGAVSEALPVPFDFVTGRAAATDGLQVVGVANETDAERGVGAAHALVWDLPSGEVIDLGAGATLTGVGGGVQVGWQEGSRGPTAALWRGARNSVVDLHVVGMDSSIACDTDGAVQVGYAGVDIRVRQEGRPRDIRFYSAGFWTGAADSFTYLSSPYRHSFAIALAGETIVGYGNTTDAIGTPRDSHAVAWVGPEHEYVDLHALLPADMRTSTATDVDEAGNIVGYGVTTAGVVRSYVWIARSLRPVEAHR